MRAILFPGSPTNVQPGNEISVGAIYMGSIFSWYQNKKTL